MNNLNRFIKKVTELSLKTKQFISYLHNSELTGNKYTNNQNFKQLNLRIKE